MIDALTLAQKRAAKNSATKGEDGHAPVLIERAANADEPEELAKKNSATPARSEKDNVTVQKGHELTREEAAALAKKNSATPATKTVLVEQPEETDDSLLTPTEFAAKNAKAKAVQSSPQNKAVNARSTK